MVGRVYGAKDFRRFLVVFAVTIFMGLAARYALVFFVDPKARFNFDINNITLYRERAGKTWLVNRYPHNAVLIGTSKLAQVNPADVDTPELQFFNASFSGALPEEILGYVRAFVPRAKLVVLSFDIMMMNEETWKFLGETDWQQPSLKDTLISHFQYLNDRDVLMEALQQVWEGIPRPGKLLPNGARDAPGDLARSTAMAAPDFERPLAVMQGAAFNVFAYSQHRVTAIEDIKTLLEQRHIPYVVLISPENRQMLEMIRTSPAAWALDRFRADIRRIFPNVLDYSDSWVSADENFYKFDPLHYLPSVGASMVREALACSRRRYATSSIANTCGY
jgi:hypothetical protein